MHILETTDDIQKFIVPLNINTEHLYYDQRMIIDSRVSTEPRTWKISKVDRLNPNGICLITLKQTEFNKNKDYIEMDINGNVIAQWADYYTSSIEPVVPDSTSVQTIHSIITYAGVKPEIKVGGNNKKFTVTFYDASGVEIPLEPGNWKISSDYEYTDKNNVIHKINEFVTITDPTMNTKLNQNQIQIKIEKDSMANNWIGKVCEIRYESNSGIVGSVLMDIVSL